MTKLMACDYIRLVLEEEFPATCLHLINQGVFYYEVTSILEVCEPLLTGLGEDDTFLRYELTGIIADYLQEK